jgi:ABC-2 type transport system ATP-binding protein
VTAPEPPALLLQDVHKRFRDVHAVRGVSLIVPQGQSLALLGPNGAGKTTLIEMVEGLQAPSAGKISVLGRGWQTDALWLRGRIGVTLQETFFFDKMTARETLQLFAAAHGMPVDSAERALRAVDLTDKGDARVRALSGGQRQRLAIAAALVHEPAILLLDEPTTGLDPHARQEIWRILEDLRRRRGTTLILTTHYMEEASVLCERIVVLDQGRILADGTVRGLLAAYGIGDVIELASVDVPLDDLPGYRREQLLPDGRRWIHVDSLTPAVAELSRRAAANAGGLDLHGMVLRQATLDDLFLHLTGRRLADDA